jgi:glycine dehydrogenase subunit 1
MAHTVNRETAPVTRGGNPHPYVPATDADRAAMLEAIGVKSFAELVHDIPERLRFPDLDLADGTPELTLAADMAAMAARNVTPGDYACFLGAGAYRHFIPSTVSAILQRGEFVTAYTPYQPEAAQGTLQTGFEFQSAICQLFDMQVTNAGMYDGPTAFAEAALMACRITRRQKVAVLETADPRLVEVLKAYSTYQKIEIVSLSPDSENTPDDIACIAIQSPNLYGVLEDIGKLTERAHAVGALSITHVNPTAHGLFQPPGKYGVDIATAEGQPLGVPLSFGGAYVGLFSCRQEHIRQLPGRIIGRTTDTEGRTGYALTLQTREQHIRRERSTSNICTSTQLIGLMVAVYMATLGTQGLREVANLCYQKAHYAASEIAKIPGYSLPVEGTFFHEFAVTCPKPVSEVNAALLDSKIIGGYDISAHIPNTMLLCFTEMNSRAEIESLLTALREIGGAK